MSLCACKKVRGPHTINLNPKVVVEMYTLPLYTKVVWLENNWRDASAIFKRIVKLFMHATCNDKLIVGQQKYMQLV